MITKERLEELIEQGAKVWCICDYTYDESKPNKKIEYYDLSNENICISPAEFRDYGLRVFDALGFWNDIRFECLFETKEEAEWHKEFGCIERTERLELPTWEEIEKDLKRSSYGIYTIVDDENVMLEYNKHSVKKNRCFYVYDNINGKMEMFNYKDYIIACRRVKDLFLGENK